MIPMPKRIADKFHNLDKGEHVDVELGSGEKISGYVSEVSRDLDSLTGVAKRQFLIDTFDDRELIVRTEFRANTEETELVWSAIGSIEQGEGEYTSIEWIEKGNQSTLSEANDV